ncbi:MAG: MBL fold metallo-hydrolase [Clostridiales bacterium]|nr:MBL fold metallo-hydrolase [Clostridiales bacterium]
MKIKRLILLLTLCLLLPLVSLAAGYDAVYDTSGDAGKLTVRFIGMDTLSGDKAGDSAVLTSPDGKIMVIDAGHPEAAADIMRALDTMGVETIDMLMASHPHIDHVGGMPALFDNYEVKAAYASIVDYNTSYTRAMMATLEKEGIALTRLKRGDSLAFGEAQVDILWPDAPIVYYDKYPEASTQFINNLSLVMKVSFKNTVFLFSGDLYTLGEKEVLASGADVKADVMKVNHHGDKTSSGKAWREAVSPQVAVITHNALADLRIPRKFEEEGARLLHTFIDGSIKVSSAGDGVLEVVVEKE